MGYGEAVRRDFTVLFEERIPLVTSTGVITPKEDCCFQLKVYADLLSDDPLRNDTSQFIDFLTREVNLSNLYFEQYNFTTGNWDFKFLIDFDNNDHGVWFPQYRQINQTNPEPTYNNLGERLSGYHVDWKSILNDYGEGTYRIRSSSAKTASPFVDVTSAEYCLRQYTPLRVAGSVRFEGSLTGYRQNLENDNKITDYSPIKWDFQIRVPDAFFGLNTEILTKEYTEYNDRSRVWIKDETLDKYIFITGKYPEWLHKELKYHYFKSDNLKVTDYNSGNANTIINLPITRSGPYDPNYQKGELKTKCEIEFERASTSPNAQRC